MAKVFLSAGHGGSDPGACAYGLREEEINLQTMLACRNVLLAHGVEVVCSRTSDENDPVWQEVREANASKANLAVSFHANGGKGDGFEAFYYAGDRNGLRLASLGEKYVKELGQNSRGLKTGNHLCFVRETFMTAVLFESFFVDNDLDNNIGDTLAEQRAFGVAYAKAILEYLGIAYRENAGTSAGTGTSAGSFLVRVKVSNLSIRTGAGVENARVGTISDRGTYTIVQTAKAKDGGTWGKLKSGAGWINIGSAYVTRV